MKFDIYNNKIYKKIYTNLFSKISNILYEILFHKYKIWQYNSRSYIKDNYIFITFET